MARGIGSKLIEQYSQLVADELLDYFQDWPDRVMETPELEALTDEDVMEINAKALRMIGFPVDVGTRQAIDRVSRSSGTEPRGGF